jgi:hypothetical protein
MLTGLFAIKISIYDSIAGMSFETMPLKIGQVISKYQGRYQHSLEIFKDQFKTTLRPRLSSQDISHQA